MNADVAVAVPPVEPITHPREQTISVHLRSFAAKIPCLRRWLRVCGALRGFADMSGFMQAMYWLGGGVRKSARLTVQGFSTGRFERRGRAGFCRRLTVQGINTGRFERRGCAGRHWMRVRRAWALSGCIWLGLRRQDERNLGCGLPNPIRFYLMKY